jgi:hypothetical protein
LGLGFGSAFNLGPSLTEGMEGSPTAVSSPTHAGKGASSSPSRGGPAGAAGAPGSGGEKTDESVLESDVSVRRFVSCLFAVD